MIHQIPLDKAYCQSCEDHLIRDISALPDVGKVTINHQQSTLSIEIRSKSAMTSILQGVQTIIESVRPCPGPEKKEITSENDHTILQQDIHCNVCNGIKQVSEPKRSSSYRKWIHVPIGILGWLLAAILHTSNTVQLILYMVSFLILGYPVLMTFLNRMMQGKWLEEKALMSIASIGAFGIHEYSEAMAIMLFYQVGEWLEERAVQKSKKTITSLLSLKPESVLRISHDHMEQIPANEVKIGDILIIKPGERIPLDGILSSGFSDLDTSTITGESLPRHFQKEDTLYAGYINLTGSIQITVTKNIHESMISRILTLVESSLKHKTKTEKFITRFSAVYTPIVVSCSLLVLLLSPLLLHWTFEVSLYRALVFLVVSCPCALIISIPLTMMNGLGAASKQGVIIKGTQALENMTGIHSLFFDKTGTITEGKLKISEWISASDVTHDQIKQWMEIGEFFSNHPIAKIIQQEIKNQPNPGEYQHYREIPGKGIIATYQQHEIVIGHIGWLEENGTTLPPKDTPPLNILLALDKKWLGGIIVEDTLKPDAKTALQKLKKLGIKQLILLSGDHKERVQKLADELQFDQAWAELLPEEKVERLEAYQQTLSKSQKTAFVGDGVNDAPVIARSDIGIAMGALGSEAAIEAADMVIMEDKLIKLPIAIQIAKKTKTIVWENIVLSLVGKAIILALGLFGKSTLWMAVFGDVGIALLAILNSVRVFYIPPNG
ncbi:cadmium-translocating P-type ATPase [bacterium]|nr:cadmium-translocating P-type ATPase [bacterium]